MANLTEKLALTTRPSCPLVWVGVCAQLEEYLVPYGGLVWVQVSGGGDGWVCRGRGSWHPLGVPWQGKLASIGTGRPGGVVCASAD